MSWDHFETLAVKLEEQILHVTVNRPDKLNALNATVLDELKQVFLTLKQDNQDFQIRGVLLSGAGEKAFIAGADIAAMSKMSSEEAEVFAGLGQEVTLLMEVCPVPVIACVHGFALGGGCEMAMSADFILATHQAVFGQPEINLALIPGFGGTQRLMRYVGLARSRELIYTGRNIKADEAHRLGLVLELYEDKASMLEAAQKYFSQFKQKSPLILSHCKSVIRQGESQTISNGLSIERRAFADIFQTEDKTEGLAAFLEKRRADFKGR